LGYVGINGEILVIVRLGRIIKKWCASLGLGAFLDITTCWDEFRISGQTDKSN
jgi:hypothetical protein